MIQSVRKNARKYVNRFVKSNARLRIKKNAIKLVRRNASKYFKNNVMKNARNNARKYVRNNVRKFVKKSKHAASKNNANKNVNNNSRNLIYIFYVVLINPIIKKFIIKTTLNTMIGILTTLLFTY